jgi:A118 family predicted phage portal protein
MPLPGNGQTWPPAQLANILPLYAVWNAWWAGNPDELSSLYGGRTGYDPTSTGFFASDAGGFRATVGRAIQRWFWGEATRGPDRRVKLHVPIAAELCQASADLLFSDTITVEADDQSTQDRLADLIDDGFHTEIATAAEVAAALGGVYLRVTWDATISPDAPFLTHVDADQAIPEFMWGRLTAVTFWQVVARDGKQVWRHLERHELDAAGNGIILHGLYEGSDEKLGHVVPLTDQPATAPLATMVNSFGAISSESPGLCVRYVPNQRPNRRWRTDPLGRNLGRSDLDGPEQLMDALDEVYTSWMRDIRLGKARLMIARQLIDNAGTGSGSAFNAEQEAYAAVNMLQGDNTSINDLITQSQFAIRVQEHKDTAGQLILDILQAAGYSQETFGIYDGGGSTKTATEIEAKQQRSLLTRDRKIREWRPALQEILEKLLWVDKAIFNSKVTPAPPDVSFPDAVQESQLTLAQTAQLLRAADAASDETIVGMLHPDWDEDDVGEEVAKIQAQRQQSAVPDPLTMFDMAHGGMSDGGTGGGAESGGGQQQPAGGDGPGSPTG